MSTQIKGHIMLSECIRAEADGVVTAFCDELGLATYSDSRDGASKRLKKAVLLVLKEATKNGDIFNLLQNRGIRIYPSQYDPGQVLAFTSPAITIEPSSTSFNYGDACTHRPYDVQEFALSA